MLSEILEMDIVHKMIVIAQDEDMAMKAIAELHDYDADATVILGDHIQDDRAVYARKMRQFGNGMYQTICMPYAVWRMLRTELEYYVSGTNKFVLYEMEPEYARICVDWIGDVKRRGFALADNFLIHLVEREYDQG